MSNYLVLDLETTTKECYGRKANPFYNEIVAIGLKYYSSYGLNEADLGRFCGLVGIYYEKNSVIIQKNWFNDVKVLVGHNIKFDLLYLWKQEALQQWILDGGKIWDTQLAEYIITGQQSKYSALRDLAVNKYGCKEREKLMEKYWEQGIDTKDIPKELVLKDVKNDVLDTEQIYLQQLEIAKKQNQIELIEHHMDALLATTEMEYNGMYVNKQMLEKNKKELEDEMNKYIQELNCLAGRYWK